MQKFSEWVKSNNPGNYVSVDLTGLPLNFVSTLPGTPNTKPHITLMYSKESHIPLEHVQYVLNRRPLTGHVVQVVGVDVFDNPSDDSGSREETLGCIVLKVKSDLINDIHNHLVRLGCKHSYNEFSPHATLIYNCPVEQCHLAAKEIEEKISGTGLFLTCTNTNNEYIKENWADTLS